MNISQIQSPKSFKAFLDDLWGDSRSDYVQTINVGHSEWFTILGIIYYKYGTETLTVGKNIIEFIHSRGVLIIIR